MTIEALRRLAELLKDTAAYAAGVGHAQIADDLGQAASATLLLLDDERLCAAGAPTRRARRPTPLRVPA